LSRDHPLYKYIDFNAHIIIFTSNNVYKWQCFTLITNEVRFNYNLSGIGIPTGIYPRGERGWGKNDPHKRSWDPRGEIFSSRGWVWGAKTRRGISRCHPYLGLTVWAGHQVEEVSLSTSTTMILFFFSLNFQTEQLTPLNSQHHLNYHQGEMCFWGRFLLLLLKPNWIPDKIF
jgi:hypothetical protein